MFHVQCNHKELAIKHYVSLIVTVYYNTFGKFLFSIFFFFFCGLVNNAYLLHFLCQTKFKRQSQSYQLLKIQSSRILQCKQDSCYVFVTLVQCTVKSSFQSNFYLVIRCDINEQILPFVLSILPLGLEMFCQCSKCYQKHDLGFLFISKNWKLCILLMI